MRTQFVECKSRKKVANMCPWYTIIAKVEGGYMAFESMDDYHTWRNQK